MSECEDFHLLPLNKKKKSKKRKRDEDVLQDSTDDDPFQTTQHMKAKTSNKPNEEEKSFAEIPAINCTGCIVATQILPETKEGKDIDARVKKLEELLEQSQSRISALEVDKEKMKRKNKRLKGKNKKLEELLEQSQSRISALEVDKEKMKGKNKKLKELLEQSHIRISALEEEKEQMCLTVSTLQDKINKLVEKEECRQFVFLLKELENYKTTADTLKIQGKLDYNGRMVIMQCYEKMNGIEKEKRQGIKGFCDSKNWEGHVKLSTGSVDDCLSILYKYPHIADFYSIRNCPVDMTVEFLESCRGSVESIEGYVKLHSAELANDPKAVLGEKTTPLEKKQDRNSRRIASMQRNKMNKEQQQNA